MDRYLDRSMGRNMDRNIDRNIDINSDRNLCCSRADVFSRLMDKIRKVDFAINETVLYLDVYPTSHEALDYYHQLLEQRQLLVDEYQSHAPLTNTGNASATSWDWINSPWPWKFEAN